MFKINQSLVEQIGLNKSVIVITPRKITLPEKPKAVEEIPEGEEKPEPVDPEVRAAQIIEGAQNEAEQIKASAWQEGYEKGIRDAETETAEMIQAHTNHARDVFAGLEKYKQDLYNELQDNLLQLSFDIAEKIVNFELQKDDKVYEGIVKKAVRNLKSADKFVLRVGKADFERFFKNGAGWLQDETGNALFEIVCDAQMGEGGCILESGDEVLNASTQMQLNKIRHQLEEKAESNVRAL